MSSFFKNFSLLDTLSILLPGTCAVLIFGYDIPWALLWEGYFDNPPSESIKLTLLIALGYFVGIIVHEMSNLLEKLLWRCSALNPRWHAYFSVQGHEFNACIKPFVNQSDRASFTPYVDKVLSICGWTLGGVILFLSATLLLPNTPFYFLLLGCVIITLPLTHLLVFKIISAICKVAPQINASEIHYIDRRIQTELSAHTQNENKRLLFDSFHCLMRNLIMLLAVVNLYLRLCGPSSMLYTTVYNIHYSSRGYALYSILFLLIIICYFRYSYLKYKYSFEDYCQIAKNRKAP